MDYATLGNTGLRVSRLGIGLSEIGYELSIAEEATAARLLNIALDGGVNFLDTSACYDISEELIGRTIAHRRQEYILATKCGHPWAGYPGQAWTARIVRESIDRSLVRLKTETIDLVQLHSCELDVLEQGDVIHALQQAKQAGKTRFIGYSGDNEAARWAVESGHFDTLQTSFNVVDQHARTNLFPAAEARGLGVIVKRPVANGAWGVESSPSRYADPYFARANTMLAQGPIPDTPAHPIALALGFALAYPQVHTAIVGTRNPRHMQANLNWLDSELPVHPEAVTEIARRFDEFGGEWSSLR
jgi:aryl-alcohol dehydrogenase-like predicted oxidoreductase